MTLSDRLVALAPEPWRSRLTALAYDLGGAVLVVAILGRLAIPRKRR